MRTVKRSMGWAGAAVLVACCIGVAIGNLLALGQIKAVQAMAMADEAEYIGPDEPWLPSIDGNIPVEISASKNIFTVGEKILVTLSYQNTTGVEARSQSCETFPVFSVKLIDKITGKESGIKYIRDPLEAYAALGEGNVVHPNEKVICRKNINEFFDMTIPGDYIISTPISRSSPLHITLVVAHH